MDNDSEIRSKIGELLTRRCNNCYRQLPGYQVHGAGWNWFTPDFGPFCNECFRESGLADIKKERDGN